MSDVPEVTEAPEAGGRLAPTTEPPSTEPIPENAPDAGGVVGKPKRAPRSKPGSQVSVVHTVRTKRFYMVDNEEMGHLGALAGAGGVALTIAGGAIGFLLDLQKDLIVAGEMDKSDQSAVDLVRAGGLGVLFLALIFAGVALINGFMVVRNIRKTSRDVSMGDQSRNG